MERWRTNMITGIFLLFFFGAAGLLFLAAFPWLYGMWAVGWLFP